MNGTSKTSSAAQSTLDDDIALLTSLLAQSGGGEEGDIEGPELQELLRRLETADGVARGVESRLDDIIGNLDRMLGGLETAGGSDQSHTAQTGAVADTSEQDGRQGADEKKDN